MFGRFDRRASSPAPVAEQAAVEFVYETVDWTAGDRGSLSEAIYEGYSLQSIHIPTAKPHPTLLVQSAAMASVAPPKPQYRPRLPASVVADGFLSDAQLESVIYAGDAHTGHLEGSWLVDATYDVVSAAPDDAEGAVRFRRGWFLGDGTGAGKGRRHSPRQLAAGPTPRRLGRLIACRSAARLSWIARFRNYRASHMRDNSCLPTLIDGIIAHVR